MKLRQIIGMYGCRQPHHKTDTHYEWATSEEDLIFHFNNSKDKIKELNFNNTIEFLNYLKEKHYG
jgi:hypothetical protein